LILGNTLLSPADAPFYRWRDGSPMYPPGDPRNRLAAPHDSVGAGLCSTP